MPQAPRLWPKRGGSSGLILHPCKAVPATDPDGSVVRRGSHRTGRRTDRQEARVRQSPVHWDRTPPPLKEWSLFSQPALPPCPIGPTKALEASNQALGSRRQDRCSAPPHHQLLLPQRPGQKCMGTPRGC